MRWSKNEPNKPVEKFFGFLFLTLVFCFLYSQMALANPYGFDNYGGNVPYGSETMLTIATNGNVSIPVQSGVLSTTQLNPTTITVTTTDQHGYKLYIRSLSSTSMTNAGNNITASANASPGSLADNTWGYTTNAGDLNNFIGITAADVEVKTASSGPYYPTGNTTDVYFGIKVANDRPAGSYTSNVVFTAVAQSP